jgi:hypothetical protein
MPEKVSEKMSAAINWQGEIGAIAGPFGGNRKSWLARAARTAQVPFRQIKALYYGESRDPKHSVGEKILSAAGQARISEARKDAAVVAEIYRRRAEALAVGGQDTNRREVDALLTAARLLGGGDST